MDKWRAEWLSKDQGKIYGDLFYDRATGTAVEMESSKAAARRLAAILKPNDCLTDVGCGAGHYYRSVRDIANVPFKYLGIDSTPYYVKLGQEAFTADPAVSFQEGDIFSLPLPDASADVVLCANVLFHLPSIAVPVAQLCRVTKRFLLIRTPISNKSHISMDVHAALDGDDFDDDGNPRGFHYVNIYGELYIRRLLGRCARVKRVSIEIDREFAVENLADTKQAIPGAWDATYVRDGMQRSGPIDLPWAWVSVEFE